LRNYLENDYLLRWVNKGFFSILDQGLFAGTNFALNIILARWMDRSSYGAFTTAYSIFLLAGTFHTAILTEPMLVFGAGKYAAHFESYRDFLIWAHWRFASSASLFLGITGLVLWLGNNTILPQALWGLAISSPFILLLWLVRRTFYPQMKPHIAAASSSLYLTLLSCLIWLFYQFKMLSLFTVFSSMGLASLLVSIVFLKFPKDRQSIVRPIDKQLMIKDHLGYGKWSAATAGLTWIPGNIYFILLPAIISLDASATFKAHLNLIMPALHMSSALCLLLLPKFVVEFQQSQSNFIKRIYKILTIFLAGSFAYGLLLFCFYKPILHWLYQGKYEGSTSLAFAICIYPIVGTFSDILGSMIRGMNKPAFIFRYNVISVIITLTLGVVFVNLYGITGAAWAMVLSSLGMMSGMMIFLHGTLDVMN